MLSNSRCEMDSGNVHCASAATVSAAWLRKLTVDDGKQEGER